MVSLLYAPLPKAYNMNFKEVDKEIKDELKIMCEKAVIFGGYAQQFFFNRTNPNTPADYEQNIFEDKTYMSMNRDIKYIDGAQSTEIALDEDGSYFGTGLVISAIVGGLYRDRMHFIWALCAVGAILVAFGWFEYLKMTDSLPFFHKSKPKKKKQ